ncbi:MAG: bifunctional folylpolyglutamate synthase/dihydrofolate synthase [Clostridiales Family XIII bacterium]|jgi:dihydrofolate synthase/folylpolyglutamate synthase|nr:bifunctional folylpolyglutamate synthase/dihydrofolate synthase [Clostridiales Family XIII bacterium]
MKIGSEERVRALSRFGSKPGLSRMRALMNRLGDPQRGLRVIHVAGTNGKGSVCRYICDGLRANGYSVGMFLSPYMTDFRDAITCDDEIMSRTSLDEYTERVFLAIDGMLADGLESPTEFEVVTALALLFFSDSPVDFVILEVGLGGRADSTNIVDDCLLSVITSISLDHCAVLGDTVEEIASEKAGIIKAGRPVVNGASGAAKAVIEREARRKGCKSIDASGIVPRDIVTDTDGTVFDAEVGGKAYARLRLSMIGRFQAENAVCALCAFKILKEDCGVALDEGALRAGLSRAALPGRFERVDHSIFPVNDRETSSVGNPIVVLDGAHNPDGMRRIAETIGSLFPRGRTLTVFSALKDKNVAEMLGICAGFSAKVIVTETENERKASVEELREILEEVRRASSALSVARDMAIKAPWDATEAALREREAYDLILVTGSLYLIREIRGRLRGL